MSTDNKQEKKMGVSDYAFKITKGNKVASIIISIILVIVGILLFIAPLRAIIAMEYIAAAAFIVYGLYRIIEFCVMAKGERNSWVLANAIIYAIVGIILLIQGPAAMVGTFAFLFGFMNMMTGISRIAASGAVKEAGGSSGWSIASGIISIITALFFFAAPFITEWVFALITGIYLVIGGVILFIDSCTAKTK